MINEKFSKISSWNLIIFIWEVLRVKHMAMFTPVLAYLHVDKPQISNISLVKSSTSQGQRMEDLETF